MNDGQPFDDNYRREFVQRIREDVMNKDFNPEGAQLKAFTLKLVPLKLSCFENIP